MRRMANLERNVLSTTAKIKYGFCALPQYDSADVMRRLASHRTGDGDTRLADPPDDGGDACDGSVS